jgi:hypothetical protein
LEPGWTVTSFPVRQPDREITRISSPSLSRRRRSLLQHLQHHRADEVDQPAADAGANGDEPALPDVLAVDGVPKTHAQQHPQDAAAKNEKMTGAHGAVWNVFSTPATRKTKPRTRRGFAHIELKKRRRD